MLTYTYYVEGKRNMNKKLLAMLLSATMVISTPMTSLAANLAEPLVTAASLADSSVSTSGANAGSGSGHGSYTESGFVPGANTGIGYNADSDATSNSGSGTDSDAHSSVESNVNSGANPSTASNAASASGTDIGSDSNANTPANSGTESNTDSDADSGSNTDSAPASGRTSDPESDAASNTDSLSDPDAESTSGSDLSGPDAESTSGSELSDSDAGSTSGSELSDTEETTEDLLLGDYDIPADHLYDDLIFGQFYNFGALYLSELGAEPRSYFVDLSLGDYLHSVRSTVDLSEFFGQEIGTDIIGTDFVVETVTGSGNTYTPVTGDASPISISFGTQPDGSDNLTFYVSANDTSAPLEGKFFLHIKFNYPDHFKDAKAKELYVPLIKAPLNETLCDTKEEAYAAVRDIIRNRTNNLAYFDDASNRQDYDNFVYDRIYVKSDLFDTGTISLMSACDFEAEREGMAPYEGDYMYNLFGNREKRSFYYEDPSFADHEGNTYGSRQSGDNTYNVFEVYMPVITTKSEEDALDAKVNALLDSNFSSLQADGVSNKEKIQAVYTYIRKNVSGTVSGAGGSDRTYPLYHTAYHALIKGNGTCESFAQLFTRLTRELGVASKVIMGLDSANHTYNIVDGGDGYWYYIDCSAGIYLTDSKNFKRADEQERFTTPGFIINYLDKVKGGSSYDVKTAKVLNDVGIVVFESYELSEVCNYVSEQSAASEDSWTIRLDSDWTIEFSSDFSFNHPGNVTLDLGGHTLTCKNECSFSIGSVKNGTIKVGHKDNISSYSGNLSLSNSNLEDITVQGVTGYDQLKVFPYGGNVRFKNATIKKMDVLLNFDRNNFGNPDSAITAEGTLTIDSCYFYAASASDHPVMRLAKDSSLVFAGTTTFGGWDYPVPEGDNWQPDGNVTNDYFIGTPIEFVPAEDDRFFVNGDVIATCTGTLKKVTSKSGKTATASLEDIVDIAQTESHKNASDESLSLITIGKSLQFAKATYSVTRDGSDSEPRPFVTLAEAANYINSLGNTSAEYTITLLDSTGSAESLVLPSKAKKVTISGAGNDTVPGPLTLRHSGNTSLATNLELKDLILAPQTEGATFNLSGRTLTVNNISYMDSGDGKTGQGAYTSVTGSGSSTLVIGSGNVLDISAKVNIANISFAGKNGTCRFADLTATSLVNEPAEPSDDSAVLVADRLSAANLYLMPGSVTQINSSALITSLFLGKNKAGTTSEGDATLLRKENTAIAINTGFTAAIADKNRLAVQTVDAGNNPIGTKGSTVLFTTKMKTFPNALVTLRQLAPYGDYTALFRTGNEICVGKSWLKVIAHEDTPGTARELGEYVRWADAISAIDTDGKALKAAEYRNYDIILSDDVDIRQKMTFPKKAAALSVISEDDKHFTLTHHGDLAPTLPLTFRDITLAVPDGMKVKLNLGSAEVHFISSESSNTYSAVSGKAKSSLELINEDPANKPVLSSAGAISTGNLKAEGYSIRSASGALTVSGRAELTDTEIDVATSLSFKDLFSLDGGNSISYADTAKGTFKISGNMFAAEDARDITATDGKATSVINSCAVSVCNKYMSRTQYPSGKDLINAAKVPACFFVIEKESPAPGAVESDPLPVKHTTRKVKKAIRINTDGESATTDGAVILRQCDAAENPLYTLGYFADLQSAFGEIKTISSKTAHYLIAIDGSKDYGKANFGLDTSNITTPAQAADIIITSLDANEPAHLHVKSSISLGSSLKLKDVIIGSLYDKKGNYVKLNISLSGNRLTLENVNLPSALGEDVSGRIGKISGNGTAKTSALELKGSGSAGACDASGIYRGDASGYTFGINADLINIGELSLNSSGSKDQHILVTGKTAVGRVSIEGNSSISSFAAIKRDKKGTVTSVSSPISITGIVSTNGEGSTLGINLLEKTGTGFKGLGSDNAFAPDDAVLSIAKPAFQIVKAPFAGSRYISPMSIAGGLVTLIKKNGSFYLVDTDALTQAGHYNLTSPSGSYSSHIDNDYILFADVVWDINNMKDKEAAYVVKAVPNQEDHTMAAAEKYAMPGSSALSFIAITAEGSAALKYASGTTLTFTSETSIGNINFEPAGHSKPLNLNLGGNSVLLENTGCGADFGNITGNGIGKNKNSLLNIVLSPDKQMVVTGNINKVNTVYVSSTSNLSSVGLVVRGKTNIGSLIKGNTALFTGSASIKLDKKKEKVTSVTSNVTIVN